MLSFNNKLSEKITVRVYGLGEKGIEAGKSETFKVKPYVSYQYDVVNYWTKAVLAQSEESVDACVSKGINATNFSKKVTMKCCKKQLKNYL